MEPTTTPRHATAATNIGLFFVDKVGDRPNRTNWINWVIVMPAATTDMEGPVYGILVHPTTVQSKGRKSRTSPENAWGARVLTGETATGPVICVKKSELEFATESRFDAEADSRLYRYGRIIKEEVILCVQVTGVHATPEGPVTLLVTCRGQEPIVSSWTIQSTTFFRITQAQYVVGFGHGEPKKRRTQFTRWGDYFDTMIGKTSDLKGLLKPKSATPVINPTGGEILNVLDPHGDDITIDVDEYVQDDILAVDHLEEDEFEHVEADSWESFGTPKSRNDAPNVNGPKSPTGNDKALPAVARTLGFSGMSLNGGSSIGGLTQKQPQPMLKPTAEVYSKHGVNMNALQVVQHNAVLQPRNIDKGKWDLMSPDSRAEWILRQETNRGVYTVTKTSTMIIVLVTIGSDPLAYFIPIEKVPSLAKQALPNKKWSTVEEPTKWINTMEELVETLKVVAGIATRYFRPDVSEAFMSIYNKAHEWIDMNLPQRGVNAYRDLYSAAIGKAIEATVEGYEGYSITRMALMELHPTSETFTACITDRLNRIDAGRAWGSTSTGAGVETDKNNSDKASKKKMSDEQRALIPTDPATGKQVCLAYQTKKGCSKTSEACRFEHLKKDIPVGLRNFVRVTHGRSE